MTPQLFMYISIFIFLLGAFVGAAASLIWEEARTSRIKRLIQYGITEFYNQEPKGIGGPDKDFLPVMQEDDINKAFADLQKAMKKPLTSEEENLDELLAAYSPKQVRAALAKMQVRVGGRFTKI